jgi:hypothetical protein
MSTVCLLTTSQDPATFADLSTTITARGRSASRSLATAWWPIFPVDALSAATTSSSPQDINVYSSLLSRTAIWSRRATTPVALPALMVSLLIALEIVKNYRSFVWATTPFIIIVHSAIRKA